MPTVTDAPFTAHVDESYFGADDHGTYTGNVDAAGRRHGRGRMVYEYSGDVYEGEWDKDLPHGIGIRYYGNAGEVFCTSASGSAASSTASARWRTRTTTATSTRAGGLKGATLVRAWHHDEEQRVDGNGEYLGTVHVATGDWTSWTWTSGSWDGPYPREAGRGTIVTARKSTGPPAPRRKVSPAKQR